MSFITTLKAFVRPYTHPPLIVNGKGVIPLSWIMKQSDEDFDATEYDIARMRQALREHLVKEEDITAYYPLPNGTTEEFWINRHEMRDKISESEWSQRFTAPDNVIRMKHYARIYDALHPRKIKSMNAEQWVDYIKRGLPKRIWELVSAEVTDFALENPVSQLKLNRLITKPKWLDDIKCFTQPNFSVAGREFIPLSLFIRWQTNEDMQEYIEDIAVGQRQSARELGASESDIEANYPLPEGTTEEFWIARKQAKGLSDKELNQRFPIPPQAVRLKYYTHIFLTVEEIRGEFQSLSREERVERVREENTGAVPDHVLEVLLDLARE